MFLLYANKCITFILIVEYSLKNETINSVVFFSVFVLLSFQINGFQDYIRLYRNVNENMDDDENGRACVFSEVNPRWQVGIARSDIGFEQISFVNNIATTKVLFSFI